MDATAQGWLVAHARASIWRLRPHLELADLVQEGHIVLLRVERTYPQASPRQLMALFKRSFENRIVDLTRTRRRYLDSFSLESELDVSLEYAAGGSSDTGQLWVELSDAEREIAAKAA